MPPNRLPRRPTPPPAPQPVTPRIVLPGAADAAAAPPEPPPPASEPPPPSSRRHRPARRRRANRARQLADLEKRFGTQWVVWVGGLALALGGIFLVRYSIERACSGRACACSSARCWRLALVGLGELARRREIIAGIAELPSAAHIPSILTAAGTTVAYADV